MKIYLLDSFHPGGVAYAAQRADIIRCDDPRARNWHEDADGVVVRAPRIGADDMARARKLRDLQAGRRPRQYRSCGGEGARHRRLPDAGCQQGSRRRDGVGTGAQRGAAGDGIRSPNPFRPQGRTCGSLPTESHDMIDSAALALMKPTAVMVNTSRGGIVNEAALYQAISSGTCSVRASTSSRPSRRRRTIR